MNLAKPYSDVDSSQLLYGVVTVGRYSRFYWMRKGFNTLEDMPEFQGRYFEFQADEDEIDHILMFLKARTK